MYLETMETIKAPATKVHLAVTLADAGKLPLLLDLLRHLDFVVVDEVEQKAADASTSAFHSIAGIWADREIDLQKIREEAFLRRTVNYDKAP